MPRKNSLKIYVENGYYHVYNRGVEKRTIFEDERDFQFFLFLLKKFLLPKELWEKLPEGVPEWSLGELAKEIDLLAYCLMPNHFHLLIKQKTGKGMTKLMGKLGTTYGMYFNKKYKRVGSLFQGVYKAARIETDAQLKHVSRYIHLNSIELGIGKPEDYPYSSYPVYLGIKKMKWLKPEEILSGFDETNKNKKLSYRYFVESEIPHEGFFTPLYLDADC